jgi:hypothetical protein
MADEPLALHVALARYGEALHESRIVARFGRVLIRFKCSIGQIIAGHQLVRIWCPWCQSLSFRPARV